MSENNTATLAARLKTRYKKDTNQIVPVPADFQRRVEWRDELEGGDKAELDIQLALERGFTQGEGTLNGAIAQITKKATVYSYDLTLQSQVSYSLIKRAESSEKAFGRFGDKHFLPMVDSMRLEEEHLALYGRLGLGVVSAAVGGGVFEISEGSWNPTIWASIIGSTLESFDSIVGTTQHNADVVLTEVAVATRRITLTGTSAAIVAGDILFVKGYHNAGRQGLVYIASRTSADTLNGIPCTYPLWCPNHYDLGTDQISLGHMLKAAGKSAGKGCVGRKLIGYVPVESFQVINNDEMGLTRHNGEKKKSSNGFEYIECMGASGLIEIVPHLYLRDGEAVLWSEADTYIVGACEATTQVGKDGDIIFDLENKNSKEMRMFSNSCGAFTDRPGFITRMTRSDGKALHV